MDVVLEGNRAICTVKKELFQKEAVLGAATRYSRDFHVSVTPVGDDAFAIVLEPRDSVQSGKAALKAVADNLSNDLIDMQSRLDLEKRFGKTRDRIVEVAFAHIK